jgi:hypothetical protein
MRHGERLAYQGNAFATLGCRLTTEWLPSNSAQRKPISATVDREAAAEASAARDGHGISAKFQIAIGT